MELDYKDIGLRIKAYRKSLGLSQQMLAELSNQEPSNVSHIERGATKLSLPTLVNIANALHVTADDLLCGSIPAASAAHDKEATLILEGCSHQERKIILGTMHALKEQLERNRQSELH